MDWINVLGFTAAILTTISFLPQAIKTIRTRHTKGISLAMYAIFTSGTLLWFLFGWYTKNQPVMLANLVTLIFALIILLYKIRYK